MELPILITCIKIAVIAGIGLLLFRWSKNLQHGMSLRHAFGKKAPDFLISCFGKVLRALILGFSALLILQIAGVNITALVAFGGVGAAALGIAGKDLIANFYGGLIIHLTRPFDLHDEVEFPQRNLIGRIEEIGWHSTLLRDRQKQPIYVPNSLFATEILINQSRMTHRRLEEHLLIHLESAHLMPDLIEQVRELLLHHPEIDREQPIDVHVASLSDSRFEVEIRAYTKKTNHSEFCILKQYLLIDLYKLIQKLGIRLAVSTDALKVLITP